MWLGIPLIGDFLNKDLHVCRHYLYDFSDRLHFGLTTYLLAFSVILIGSKQHFGKPIDCMLPKEIDEIGSWKSFINSYCLFYGTYRFTLNETTFNFPGHSEETSVAYYQWVPFFLAFQVFCFVLPHWIWTWMQKLLYLDMSLIVEHTNKLLFEKDIDSHNKKKDYLVSYAYEHFKYRRMHKIGYFSFLFIHPSFAYFLYLFTKVLFIVNDIIQLNLVTSFLGFNSINWGFQMIKNFIMSRSTGPSAYDLYYTQLAGNSQMTSAYNQFNHFKAFPILVACDFHTVPSIGRVVNNTAQCVIPLNIVNEKLFVILWLWIVFLIALALMSLIQWIVKFSSKASRESIVLPLLMTSDLPESKNSKNMLRTVPDCDFVHKFLGHDGVLLIQFMTAKCGVLKSQEIVCGLYEKFREDFTKPTKPVLMKKGEKTDYSEMNFGNDEHDMYRHKGLDV